MKKLLYVSSYSENDHNQLGIFKKIIAQMACFQKHYVARAIMVGDNKEEETGMIQKINVKRQDGSILKVKERLSKVDKIKRQISIFCPDIIYFRYALADPIYYKLFCWIKNMGLKIYTEHQTKELEELISTKKYIYAVSEKLYGEKMLNMVDGIVAVTSEILQYEKKRSREDIPGLVVGNGISVKTIKQREIKKNSNIISMLFVGNISEWQGLDRLINGAAAYNGEDVIRIDIVGSGDREAIDKIKKIIENKKVDNVFFHGAKTGIDLDEYYNQADIAIGPLAVHRKGLREATPLKVREYCARGIPFIYAYDDPDINNFPYGLKVQANEKPIDIAHVIDFYNKTKGKDVCVKMVSFANAELEWMKKIEKVASFIGV